MFVKIQFKSVVISNLATVSSICSLLNVPADWRLRKLAEPYEHEHSEMSPVTLALAPEPHKHKCIRHAY